LRAGSDICIWCEKRNKKCSPRTWGAEKERILREGKKRVGSNRYKLGNFGRDDGAHATPVEAFITEDQMENSGARTEETLAQITRGQTVQLMDGESVPLSDLYMWS
jgi:hypothetical protein